MTIKSTTRAPRKTKVAQTIETPAPEIFAAEFTEARMFGALVIGTTAHVATSLTVVSLISLAISLPTLSGAIWFISMVLTLVAAIAAGTWVSNRVVEFILDQRDVAVINAARKLFNFRKEVTA